MAARIAVLADIHANVWALEAVLRDARALGVDGFVNLGDVLYGPLKPRETFDLLMREPALATVQGNQDRQLPPEIERELGAKGAGWLRARPPTAVLDGEMFLCHGAPGDDRVYLLEDVSSGRPAVRSDAAILELLGGVTQPLVLCGHTHIPRLVRLSTGQLVLNPGSVGLPAYRDDQPVEHAMETHSPHASCAIVARNGGQWNVCFRRIAYDHDAASRQARALGRPDWASSLATGRVESAG